MGALIIHNAAPARPADPSLYDLIDVLIVNRVEAAALSKHPLQSAAEALQVLAGMANDGRTVVITLGAEGLAYRQAGMRARHLPAFPVTAHSTHGAGDAFCGAFAAQLALGSLLEPSLRYAQAAAALHVSTSGAARSAIGPGEVRRFLEQSA